MTGTAIALPARQRTPAWHEARKAGIGSSDAPVIAGVAPWGDIRTLFAEKVGWAAPRIETAPMSWGRHLEPAIAAAYADETGRKVRRANRLLRHRELPWLLASLDRVVVGERRGVEIKTARFANENWGVAGTDEIPDHVRIQVEHQMMVTGYPVTDVVVLFAGSDLRIYTVEADRAIQADLLDVEQRFWDALATKHLPADLLEEDVRATPLRDGEVDAAELSAAVPLLAIEVASLRQSLKKMEAAKEQGEVTLKALVDEYTAIRGATFRITYRQQADKKKVSWELVAYAYRSMLQELVTAVPGVAELLGDRDLDTVEGLFTTTSRGNRPLLITIQKESDVEPL